MSIKDIENSIRNLVTEAQNPDTLNLDKMSSEQIAAAMNRADAAVPQAIERILPQIAEAIDAASKAIRSRGRLIYFGAGTSGRLGVLDASECPPTFGVSPATVIGIMAGGRDAMFEAKEGIEDSAAEAVADLKAIQLTDKDVAVGLSASGRTPYVIHGLKYAKECGAGTVALSCNAGAEISALADTALEVIVGPEVLSGSTRLKAGTAQKLVLNMISTGAMVRLGKCYQNLMVDLKVTNSKLEARGARIVMQTTGVSFEEASAAIKQASGSVKLAIASLLTGLSVEEAKQKLAENDGILSKII